MTETKLILHDGYKVIGAPKIELVHGATRLLLDFGLNYDRFNHYFQYDPYVNSNRTVFARHVQHQRRLGLLPFLTKKERYFSSFVESKEENTRLPSADIDGILLTHAHVDHHGAIKYLNPRIPLYCHPVTAAFFRQQHIKLYFYKRTPGKMKNERANNELFRPINSVAHLQEFKIGDLSVTAHLVDHSIPGALSYMITLPSGEKIVYSGDFRTHGITEEATYTDQWIAWLEEQSPIDVLICEGTNIDEYNNAAEESSDNEWSVKKYIHTEMEYTEKQKGLVFISVSGNHVARLDTLWEIARDSNKQLVIPVYSACLLRRLDETNHFTDPDHIVNNLDKVLIYERYDDELLEKMTGVLDELSYYSNTEMATERDSLPNPYNSVELSAIKQYGPGAMVVIWEGDIQYLPDINPPPQSKFIHSTWEPFNEELEIKNNIVRNCVDSFHMTYHHIHVSGHIYGPQLKKTIARIAPKTLVPVHTLHPELFNDIPNVGNVTILKNGETLKM